MGLELHGEEVAALDCSLLPIVAEDAFQIPDEAFLAEIQHNGPAVGLQSRRYVKIINAPWPFDLFKSL